MVGLGPMGRIGACHGMRPTRYCGWPPPAGCKVCGSPRFGGLDAFL